MPNKQLRDLGYEVYSKLVRDNYDGVNGDHVHEVTLRLGDKNMTCEYTSGCAHRHMPRRPLMAPRSPLFSRLTVHDLKQNRKSIPNDPELADVLYSLLLDASVGRHAMSFGEFCEECGYDEDSRKALKVFEACQEQYSKLRRLGVCFEALDAILEDY